MKYRKTGFIKKIMVGVVIGLAAITPGLSAGVLAASFGLYEPILNSVTHLRKEFKQGIQFLMPIIIGTIVGIFCFGNLMEYLMVSFETTVIFAFLGLIAGSFPSLVHEANDGVKKIKISYIITAIISFLVIMFLNVSMKRVIPQGLSLNPITSIICGGVIAIGTVIPGISSSFMLIQLGVYKELLAALTSFDYKTVLFLGLGFGVTAIAFIFIASYLFNRFRAFSYYGVIGFLLGSVTGVFPGFSRGYLVIIDLIIFAICAVCLWVLMNKIPSSSHEKV